MKKLILLTGIIIFMAKCSGEKKITPELKKMILSELNEIKVIDQKYAGMPPSELIEDFGSKKAWEIFLAQRDSIGNTNQQKIKDLFKQYGYLGEQKIGKDASSDFWLPIQHADNDIPFQEEMLAAMKNEIEKGSDDKYLYAMLEDRINVNLKKYQRFGSQVMYNEDGQAIPKIGFVDSLIVDSLRSAYGLPSLKEYYNDMTIMNFEMNKQMFLDKGIKEPQLYK